MPEPPPVPIRKPIDPAWPHAKLHERVRESLSALPSHFDTEIFISGIRATDLHTLNSVLGATIEDQVVATLNSMHSTWDPDEKYAHYSFVRQPQTFPDVLLRRAPSADATNDILMGVELKGWYLLAKEREPNFRFTVTEKVCNPQDLLVVVPWVLSQVISGKPMVFTPYIEPARFAAAMRNYHWQYLRKAKGSTKIKSPTVGTPYPSKAAQIQDIPEADDGGNFGRFARTGIMDAYLKEMQTRPLAGIPIEYWLTFFKAFQEHAPDDQIRKELERLVERVDEEPKETPDKAVALQQILSGLVRLLDLK